MTSITNLTTKISDFIQQSNASFEAKIRYDWYLMFIAKFRRVTLSNEAIAAKQFKAFFEEFNHRIHFMNIYDDGESNNNVYAKMSDNTSEGQWEILRRAIVAWTPISEGSYEFATNERTVMLYIWGRFDGIKHL